MRNPGELLASALCVIDKAFALSKRVRFTAVMYPLYSGGYDSWCACYCASQHKKFRGEVHHINTGIGSKATRKYAEETCDEFDWDMRVYQSKESYEDFVKTVGFPGPGGHNWVYQRLKERCIEQMTKGRQYTVLVTGCRSHESVRRMGHVEPVRWGEVLKDGTIQKTNRIWVNPCHNWTDEEQREFIKFHDLTRNPVKDSILGMSGECFCGAFARPNELEMLRAVCPDVACEIDRLTEIAKEAGTPSQWGCRPKKTIETVETGPLCNSCDRKATAAGVVFKPIDGCGMIPKTEVDHGEGQT